MNSLHPSLEAPTAASWGFAEDYAPSSDAVRESRHAAISGGEQPISQGVASALTFLARAVNARAVVEIGTAGGTSALAFFDGMARDGIITSIDADAGTQLVARAALVGAGIATNRFRLISGIPLDVLPKLRDGAYDIVFINGDKLEYVEYVAGALRLLRHGGLVVVHDVLWHNLVADPADESDETLIIREALEAVTESESYTAALLPVGNGLLTAVKQ